MVCFAPCSCVLSFWLCSCCVLFKLDSFLLPFFLILKHNLTPFLHPFCKKWHETSVKSSLIVLNIILVPPYVPTEPPRGHGDGEKIWDGKKNHFSTSAFAHLWILLRHFASARKLLHSLAKRLHFVMCYFEYFKLAVTVFCPSLFN